MSLGLSLLINAFCSRDTQIGRQLRALDQQTKRRGLFVKSRIFSSEIGLRPAEPCSLTVAATHQLLTNLFEYMSIIILSNNEYRSVTGAVITEQDLEILERCNRDNIAALEDIVGVSVEKRSLTSSRTATKLRKVGKLWSQHILENAIAYAMTIIYIFVTVTSGWPVFYAIARAFGLNSDTSVRYFVQALDSCLFIALPQVNVLLLRLIQGRNILHRMVGRTVVVADIPWVAQCGDAFLSKIFACSYSIAGVNVIHGNPSDHLVHRHTHRVVRGALVVCGRPDGRLSALSTAEAAACLSVTQASSIQSWGGTCESITIGHNPFALPLSSQSIFLKRSRPLFLCERMLIEQDKKTESQEDETEEFSQSWSERFFRKTGSGGRSFGASMISLEQSMHLRSSVAPRRMKVRSAGSILGEYMNFNDSARDFTNGDSSPEDGDEDDDDEADETIEDVINDLIRKKKWSDGALKLFKKFDVVSKAILVIDEAHPDYKDNGGYVDANSLLPILENQFGLSGEEASKYLNSLKLGERLNFHQFLHVAGQLELETFFQIPPSHVDARGNVQLEPSNEKYFGMKIRRYNAGSQGEQMDFALARSQEFAMELYESRIASLQRFVAMVVIFHEMGDRVQSFFRSISLGFWGYRMDRTHSIMRIATTASPVSGADVKTKMEHLQRVRKVRKAIDTISTAYLRYKNALSQDLLYDKQKSVSQRVLKAVQSMNTDDVCSIKTADKEDPNAETIT